MVGGLEFEEEAFSFPFLEKSIVEDEEKSNLYWSLREMREHFFFPFL